MKAPKPTAGKREPVRLDSLKAGATFRWCDILFTLRKDEPKDVSFHATPHLSVVYLEPSGRGAFDAGDKGLMPVDAEVEPVSIEAKATWKGRVRR